MLTADSPRKFGAPASDVDHTPGGVPDVGVGTSLRVGHALHRIDGNAVLGSDYAHAWAILLVQIGEDRAFDVGSPRSWPDEGPDKEL